MAVHRRKKEPTVEEAEEVILAAEAVARGGRRVRLSHLTLRMLISLRARIEAEETQRNIAVRSKSASLGVLTITGANLDFGFVMHESVVDLKNQNGHGALLARLSIRSNNHSPRAQNETGEAALNPPRHGYMNSTQLNNRIHELHATGQVAVDLIIQVPNGASVEVLLGRLYRKPRPKRPGLERPNKYLSSYATSEETVLFRIALATISQAQEVEYIAQIHF
ncbi:hypothetical protein B0H13DRAFT_1851120 [Mycena leptocephala]|nr:hypothetical protein B0H13DRAFT_1851120 [Mycena leptocephala]